MEKAKILERLIKEQGYSLKALPLSVTSLTLLYTEL